MACLSAERAGVRELAASCHTPVGIHADHVANGLRVCGFAGLPDGSAWIADDVLFEGDAEPAEAGRELARRMLAAGAADLLRDAEAMAQRGGLPR
jgi:hydroxymethylbilane synthase